MTPSTVAPDRRAIAWPHGVLAVERLGGMLAPATFVLPDGQQVSPLQVAPWFHETEAAGLPGVLRQLRGEWACVPFGYPLSSAGMGSDWVAAIPADEVVEDAHGFAANHDWAWAEPEHDKVEGVVALSCIYPETSPVVRLDRMVRPDPTNGVDGSFALADHEEGYRVRLSWDPGVCPSVLLWISNRGRKDYPWSGRHLAVGIEPIASPFGLGPATAAMANPIAESGTPTAVDFDPAKPFLTRYRFEVEPL